MNLANQLTVLRIGLTAAFVLLMSFSHISAYCLAYLAFTVAAITDYYDGKIARERNLTSNFGKLLDPVADKVLMAAGFIMLMRMPLLWIPGWTIVAIIAREFLITGARSLAASRGAVLPANIWGKVKTTAQMIYVFVMLFFVIVGMSIDLFVAPRHFAVYGAVLRYASLAGILVVALLTVYSGAQFVWGNRDQLGLDGD